MTGTVVRGIRGAITVEQNDADQIALATQELMLKLIEENDIETEDIASCLITVTDDLDANFPAHGIRQIGAQWAWVPLMCTKEMQVPGSLPRCIRILLHVNTTKKQQEIHHVYLREAVKLRPDLVKKES